MLKLSLNSFREEAIALVAGLVVFAVYYPLAVWVHRDFGFDRAAGRKGSGINPQIRGER